MSNPYTDLVNALKAKELTHNQIQIAYRAWIRQREDLPESIRGLLGGHERKEDAGLLYEAFLLMSHIIGNAELAYRRGYSEGYEDAKKEVGDVVPS